MREICFILVENKILRIYFGTAISIPDSRERWEAIWQHRDQITEIVHSHPGEFLDFSHEDLTTMEAVEAGTGKEFTWSIVTKTGFLSRKGGKDRKRDDVPWWLSTIRELSYGSVTTRRAINRRAGRAAEKQERQTRSNRKEPIR